MCYHEIVYISFDWLIDRMDSITETEHDQFVGCVLALRAIVVMKYCL